MSESKKEAGIPYFTPKTSGTKIPYKWKAIPDGTYNLIIENKDISSETIYELRQENLYVYHQGTDRLFILKSFIYKLDGMWLKGKIYE